MRPKQTRPCRFEALHHKQDMALALLPLRGMLAKAQKDLPARTSLRDVNEELALELIKTMKLQFKKAGHPVHWAGSPEPTQMVK